MKIVNECRIDFEYTFGKNRVTKTIYSNESTTDIVTNMLKVDKNVDKSIASVFEVLTYTIIITNLSNVTVNNVFLQDILPKGAEFIFNSVYINGVQKRCVNPNEGFNVGYIDANNTLVVTFKVVVNEWANGGYMVNNSAVVYDYIYNLELPPLRMPVKSGEVQTKVKNNLFKQININYSFEIESDNYYVKDIKNVEVKINILKSKIVSTPFLRIKDYIYKLIVLGSIEYTITYNYSIGSYMEGEGEFNEGVVTDVEGFSTFLLVPCGVKYIGAKNINYTVEDMSYKFLGNNTIFVDITLLIIL